MVLIFVVLNQLFTLQAQVLCYIPKTRSLREQNVYQIIWKLLSGLDFEQDLPHGKDRQILDVYIASQATCNSAIL